MTRNTMTDARTRAVEVLAEALDAVSDGGAIRTLYANQYADEILRRFDAHPEAKAALAAWLDAALQAQPEAPPAMTRISPLEELTAAVAAWVPQHSWGCANQPDDEDCICGTSRVYEAALAATTPEDET